MVLLRHYPIKISPFGWLPYPLKSLEHINISRPLPLFLLFQEPSNITKVIEEIFEVNEKPQVTSIIIDTLPEVHSFTPHSNKHLPKEESITPKPTNATATTSQPTRTKPSTATLERKGPTRTNKIPKLTKKSSPSPLM